MESKLKDTPPIKQIVEPSPDLDKMIELYKTNPIRIIAEKMGCSNNKVWKQLRAAGVKMNNRGFRYDLI